MRKALQDAYTKSRVDLLEKYEQELRDQYNEFIMDEQRRYNEYVRNICNVHANNVMLKRVMIAGYVDGMTVRRNKFEAKLRSRYDRYMSELDKVTRQRADTQHISNAIKVYSHDGVTYEKMVREPMHLYISNAQPSVPVWQITFYLRDTDTAPHKTVYLPRH